MANIAFTKSLQKEYQEMYSSTEIKESRYDEVDLIVNKILSNKTRYENVAQQLGAPWYFIGAIHNMESSLRFSRHLHNGDPLSARTIQVPAGRPRTGSPPFTWEESAQDALKMSRIHRVQEWTIPRILYQFEKYNGWGYRLHHQHVKSPYLWGYSNHYTSGKYIADGTWSDSAVSRQCGAAVIIRRIEELNKLDSSLTTDITELLETPFLFYAEEVVDRGIDLQKFLNTFPSIAVRVDGWPGKKTSDAVEKVFGFKLNGDPRN